MNEQHKILVLPGINGRFLHTGTNVPDRTGTFVPATQMCVKVLINYFLIFFFKLSQYKDIILTIPAKKYKNVDKFFFFISITKFLFKFFLFSQNYLLLYELGELKGQIDYYIM